MTQLQGEFPIAQAIRDKIFKIPLLPQEKIKERFKSLDTLLHEMIFDLVQAMPSVRAYYVDIIFRLIAGKTLGKNFFDKEDHEDGKGKRKKDAGIYKKSELRLLKSSFALVKLEENPEAFEKICRKAGFLRGVHEEAIHCFLEVAKEYPELVEQLRKAEAAHSPESLKIENKLLAIETELNYYNREALLIWITRTKKRFSSYVAVRDELISPYFRLVYTEAKKHSTSDSQTLDNFQNGVFGLVRAVKCYTPSRFAAFSVVARTWIKQSILLNLKSEVNFIKLPVANWHVLQKIDKIKQDLEQKGINEPTSEQIAKAGGMPLDKVEKILENAKLVKVVSLNAPPQGEGQEQQAKWNLENVVSNEDLHANLEWKNDYELIENVCNHFDEEEKLIFSLMTGCSEFLQTQINPILIAKEKIKQQAAALGFDVNFKE